MGFFNIRRDLHGKVVNHKAKNTPGKDGHFKSESGVVKEDDDDLESRRESNEEEGIDHDVVHDFNFDSSFDEIAQEMIKPEELFAAKEERKQEIEEVKNIQEVVVSKKQLKKNKKMKK